MTVLLDRVQAHVDVARAQLGDRDRRLLAADPDLGRP
jgi:hypothetical protein